MRHVSKGQEEEEGFQGSVMSQFQGTDTTCTQLPLSEGPPQRSHKNHSQHVSSPSLKVTKQLSQHSSAPKNKRHHRHDRTVAHRKGSAQTGVQMPPRPGSLNTTSANRPLEVEANVPNEGKPPHYSSGRLPAACANADSGSDSSPPEWTSGRLKHFAKVLSGRGRGNDVNIPSERTLPHRSSGNLSAASTDSTFRANSPTRQRKSGRWKHFSRALFSRTPDTVMNVPPERAAPTMSTNVAMTSSETTPDGEAEMRQQESPNFSCEIVTKTPPNRASKPKIELLSGNKMRTISKCTSVTSTRAGPDHCQAPSPPVLKTEKVSEDTTRSASNEWKHIGNERACRANMETNTEPFNTRSSYNLTGVSLACEMKEELPLTQQDGGGFKRLAGAMQITSEATRTPEFNAARTVLSRKCILTDIGSPDDTSQARVKGFSSPKLATPGSAFSTRLPWSALATSDDTRLSRVSRWKLCVLIATPCAFLGAAILLMQLFQRGPRMPLVRLKQIALWVQQLGNACSTVGCERAVSEMRSSIDTSVDPCWDFYSFACGHWARDRPDASYMAVQQLSYIAAVNKSLWNVGHLGFDLSPDDTRELSTVYRSCLRFIDREKVNIEEAWRAAGIDAHLWTSLASFHSLFAVVIGNLLQYNLESVINARWTNNNDSGSPALSVSLEVSTGTAIARHLDQSFRKALMIRAVEASGAAAHDHFPLIEHIDDTVLKITQKMFSGLDAKVVHARYLDTGKVNWSQVLSALAKLFDKPAPAMVRVRNVKGVQDILEFLGRVNLRTVSVYLALVPLTKFFVLARDIQRRIVSYRENDEDKFKYEACVRALELLFADSYREWMSARIEGSSTPDDVNQVFTDVLTTARNFTGAFSRIPLDERRIVAPPYLIRGSPEYASDPPNSMAETNDSPTKFSSDFIANTILFSQQRSRGSGGASCEPVLTINSIGMRWNDTDTLLRLLMPDFYQAGAKEAAVNYGTLAYYLASAAFQAAVAENWTSSADYGPCIADYVHSRMGFSLHEHSWDYIVAHHWALQVALKAAVMRDPELRRSGPLSRLFLLRFARTCCSPTDIPRAYSDINEIDQSPESCNAVAMTLPAFAGAFGCLHMPPIEC